MISSYWGSGDYGGYSWELIIIRARTRVMMKERKYSLIRPFWLETVVDDFIWK